MSGFFRRYLRGARLIEFGALTVVLALALGVYLVKARAGRETGDITQVESQIADEQHRVRLLQAEVAHLEQPARLQHLAEAAGLGPTADKRETSLDHLTDVAHQSTLPDSTHVASAAPAPTPAPAPAAPASTGAPQ